MSVALITGLFLSIFIARQQVYDQYEHRSLAIAQTTAAIPEIHRALLQRDRSGTIQSIAQSIRRSSGARYVVVTDRDGIRYSHANPAMIGRRVDENPGSVLAGTPYVGIQEGTLGVAARGKAPIWDSGRVIGIVSVGYPVGQADAQLLGEIPAFVITLVVALALGLIGSVFLARHIKRHTFGLEPWEIAGLLEEREASLQGIREGALATDRDGRITLANDEARRLLGLDRDPVGLKAARIVPEGRMRRLLEGRLQGRDQIVLVGPRMLVCSRMPVVVRGEEIGHVITLRDRIELEGLSSQPGGVGHVTEALRAQAHEFSNRLHTVAGLLELGRTEEAIRLIADTSGQQQDLAESLQDGVGDPVLSALLLAKSSLASERGIELRLDDDVLALRGKLPLDPQELITVVGNLIDNGLDAAASSEGPERWVRVSVRVEDGELVVRVRDSGPGVHPAHAARVFEDGFSTKDRRRHRGHGLGLALVREVVDQHGGEIGVRNDGGAVFTVRLPMVGMVEKR